MTEESMASNRHHDRVNLIKERKNRDIRSAAYKLFMAKDYDAITMDEVSLAAKVSKATLYKHFETKEKLYLETMQALFMEREESIEDHHESLDAFLTYYVEMSVSKKVTNLMRHCASQMIRFPSLAELAWHHYKPTLERLEAYWHNKDRKQQGSCMHTFAQAQTLLALIHAEIIYPVWYGFQSKPASDAIAHLIQNFIQISASKTEPQQHKVVVDKKSPEAENRDHNTPLLRATFF